jgi:nucleotide-binding universal stress UspA family protein
VKLIVALDTSAASQAVVAEIAARPWPSGSEMRVLHVVDLFSLTGGMVYSQRVEEAAIDGGEALVRAAADKLASRGIKTSTAVVEGYPRTEIIDQAVQSKADFIITGSHGRGPIGRFFLGSVAKEVVRGAPCSVEIVRSTTQTPALTSKGPMKILAATDGSTSSEAALRSIVARPWPADSEIKVASVIDATLPAIEPWYGAQGYIARLDEDRSRLGNEAVAAAENILVATGLKVTRLLGEGNPKERIADLAHEWEADLIVVGSHGRRGLNRMLLGSVSESVAAHAYCSVDVIREQQ